MQQRQYKQKLVLGYFKIRGIGQTLRYLLEITDSEYEERFYDYSGSKLDKQILEYEGMLHNESETKLDKNCQQNQQNQESKFLQENFIDALYLPAFPHLLDGDFKIPDTGTIANYIINRSGRYQLLGGSDDKQKAIVNMLQSQVIQFQFKMYVLIYDKEFYYIKDKFFANKLLPFLKSFSKFLGDKQFLCGHQVTLPDIYLYEICCQISQIFRGEFNEFENLKNLMRNFEEIPRIKAYMSSDRFIKSPFNFSNDRIKAQWNDTFQ